LEELGGMHRGWFASPRRRRCRPVRQLFSGAAHRGVPVQWRAVVGGSDDTAAKLPTYAFQRSASGLPRDPSGRAAGGGHWLLTAESRYLRRTRDAGWLFAVGCRWTPIRGWPTIAYSARWWWRCHSAGRGVVVGRQVGSGIVEELVQGTPLVVPPSGWVDVQVAVGDGDEQGCRSLVLRSRTGRDARG